MIELLIVVSIISLLVVSAITNMQRGREKARDTARLADMIQIQKALDIYHDKYGYFPTGDGDGCGGWDVGNKSRQLLTNRLPDIMNKVPNDSLGMDNCSGYRYYRYPAGSNGCSIASGAFYVLGVADMESSGRPYPTSPGWRCPSRNWQTEMDWVAGKFEK